MANYADSVLAKAQTVLNQRFQAAEMRIAPSTTLMTLAQNTEFLIPDIRDLRDREDRATKTYLKDRASRSLTNSRTASHTGVTSDSTEVDIDFTTYTDKFTTSLKRGDNNVFSDAEIMAHEIENSFRNLHEGIETDLVAWLDSNKTQVSSPVSTLKNATFNGTNDVFEVDSADQDRFWDIVKSVYRQEKYSGSNVDFIADPILTVEGNYQINQGGSNGTNLGYQFQGVNVKESVEVADASYAAGFGYGCPFGMWGIIDWIPKQNRSGEGDYDSFVGGFGTIVDPMSGLSFALHGYSQRADTSATNGSEQDVAMEWELSIDLSPQYAPISTSNQSPIFGFGIV